MIFLLARSFVVLVAVFLAMPCARAAAAIDDAREERWAREILPSLMVGDAVYLSTPGRAKVLALLTPASGAEKGRVVVVHGLGVNPDFGMIGVIRGLLADAGYTTLAVQMPVLAADAPREDYPVTFTEAGARLEAAVAFLRARGPGMVALVSHSMGAAMSNAWRSRQNAAPIDAWIPIGMPVAFSIPPRTPVQDVLAERELPDVVASAPMRKRDLPHDRCSRQVVVPGADHYFEGSEKALVAAIVAFLDRVGRKEC